MDLLKLFGTINKSVGAKWFDLSTSFEFLCVIYHLIGKGNHHIHASAKQFDDEIPNPLWTCAASPFTVKGGMRSALERLEAERR